MNAAEIPFGGVSPGFTRRLKGQSTIEYVLVIAIIALVFLIAGPWVSSAIRNQFNLVAGAIGSGTAGESFREPQDIPDAQNGTAFAVYSEDDRSLMFYKRRGVPKVGEMFNYRHVTEVYTGFETRGFGLVHYNPERNNWDTCDTDVPWYEMRTRVTKVAVVDRGIKPRSLAQYFRRFESLESADLGNFDLSGTVSLHGLFLLCSSLRSANAPSVSSACADFQDAFAYCPELQDLYFNGCDFSGANSFFHTFLHSGSLSFDCSSWNAWPDVLHSGFNGGSPGVIPPRVWQ
ncbi:Uncharacterised protein [Collinsella aerofaciens]|nr:Uncharacterised protein [Collinsella aerofaciens]